MIKNTGPLTLSACMIVKDEEHNIRRCLNSIRNFVDEIVIVDTGSSDRTIEIAKSFRAKVYEHKWENDFSKHRNQSINYATTDWIFIIDADEELVTSSRDPNILKNSLSKVPDNFHAAGMVLHDWQGGRVVMELNTSRFFRKGCIQYKGIVHNQPQVKTKSAFLGNHISLNHYGYDLTPEKKQQKFKRTSSLLMKELENNPENYSCYFYLAELYADIGATKTAIENAEKYISFRDKIDDFNFNKAIYYMLFNIYMKVGDVKMAEQTITRGMKELPGDLDLSMGLVEFGAWTNRHELIFLGGNQFVKLYEAFKNPEKRQNRFCYMHNPEALAYVLNVLMLSQLQQASLLMTKLNDALKDCAEDYRNGLAKESAAELSKIKLPGVFIGGNTHANFLQSLKR